MKTTAKSKRNAGRPRTGKLAARLAIRLTDAQRAAIQAEVDETGSSISEVVLSRLFSGTKKNPVLKPV